ncbi:MAG TPA: thioredoxin [Elusimicrobia bacterium]|nr:thioredoxin [Elusimicrobiota bacterium]
MSEIQLTDDTFEKEVLQSPTPVLVDFWAPWCGPCRMLGPVIEELAKEYEGKVRVAKLNVDDNQGVASRFNVSAIPTLMVFKGGKVEQQMVGVHSKADIQKVLNQLVG